MPKLDTTRWQDHAATTHRLTGQSNGPFSELVLGDQAGLSQFGVHLERLQPGSRSSFRHWHETEDELVYVLDGEVVLMVGTRAAAGVVHYPDHRLVLRHDESGHKFFRADGSPVPEE